MRVDLVLDDNEDVDEREILSERIAESNYQKQEKQENVKLEKLPQRSTKHPYSGCVGEKAEMMRQFYKAKITLDK